MIWAIAAVGGLVLAYAVWTYNRLVRLSMQADAAWSDIDVQLKRRWDLVPALVGTVEGYTQHESETLREVVLARAQAEQAPSPRSRGASESNLSNAVRHIFALVESYPDLKASQNYLDLHKSLVDIENNVQYARRYYNAVVRDLNTLVGSFPPNVVATVFGYREREFFQLDESAERAAPAIDLSRQN